MNQDNNHGQPIPKWMIILHIFTIIFGCVWYYMHSDGIHNSMNTKQMRQLQDFVTDFNEEIKPEED